MSRVTVKPVSWVGSSFKDLLEFQDPVQDSMGYALYQAQIGLKHDSAKPLKGFGGAGVLEIVATSAGDAFRAVYTVSSRRRSMSCTPSRRSRSRESTPRLKTWN